MTESRTLDPLDYISAHLFRQQGETPNYGELLEPDGSNAMAVKVDEAYGEWLAGKIATQEDLPVEHVPDEAYYDV